MNSSFLPGLYVHIPFCVRKCTYCDFLSFGRKDAESLFGSCDYPGIYFDALVKQLEYLAGAAGSGIGVCGAKVPGTFDTVYIGGGTPCILPEGMIYRLLGKIKKLFDISNDAEITIELNPGVVTGNKLSEYKNAGVNRVSAGIQSLNGDLLRTLGRIHSKDEALGSLALIGKFFENVNADFIFGIPSVKNVSPAQTEEDIAECLDAVFSYGLPHASFYSLIIEPGTDMYEKTAAGLTEEFDADEERKIYRLISAEMKEKGYIHYEISNFAKPGSESSHNMKYWSGRDYLGAGLGAVSYLGVTDKASRDHVRFRTVTSPSGYVEGSSGGDVYETQERLDTVSRKKEYMMMGFRKTAGPDPRDYGILFGSDLFGDFSCELQELSADGLIRQDLSLTDKGLDFGNLIFEKFI